MEHTTWTSDSTPYLRPKRPGERDAWSDEAAAEGATGTSELREVAQTQPPLHIARALGLEAEELVVVRRRLVLLDGQPVELADSYYPLSIAGGTPLAEARKIRGGAVSLLASLGLHPSRVRETVAARPATEPEHDLLDLGPHDWVLMLTRVTYADNGTPFEATVMTMIAAGRELRYEMTIQEG